MLCLHEDPRFKLGLVLDGWMFPLQEEECHPAQPILFINTESFITRMNVGKTMTYLRGSTSAERRMFFILGSVHLNHVDVPLIVKSNWIKKLAGMYRSGVHHRYVILPAGDNYSIYFSTTDPALVLGLNNNLMLHFIGK